MPGSSWRWGSRDSARGLPGAGSQLLTLGGEGQARRSRSQVRARMWKDGGCLAGQCCFALELRSSDSPKLWKTALSCRDARHWQLVVTRLASDASLAELASPTVVRSCQCIYADFPCLSIKVNNQEASERSVLGLSFSIGELPHTGTGMLQAYTRSCPDSASDARSSTQFS